MRQYIRHPSDIPIKYNINGTSLTDKQKLQDISYGGLCFNSETQLMPDSAIHLSIPIDRPPFEVNGIVVWCYGRDGEYRIGVKFHSIHDEFSIRMVEQVCYIEHYRNEVYEIEGRKLSSEGAAREWIEKFAHKFAK